MSSQNLTYQDLLQIVEWIKSSDQFGEFHLKMGDVEVHLRRRGTPPAPVSPPVISEAQPPIAASPPLPAPPPPNSQAVSSPLPTEARNGHTAPVAEAACNVSPAYPEHAVIITSPMVGTFYRAPEPGAAPFVEVGQWVEPDTTVCIIEVMKLMHSMPARQRGVVTHILVQDAAPVEYGQALIVLDPQGEAAPSAQRTGAAATP